MSDNIQKLRVGKHVADRSFTNKEGERIENFKQEAGLISPNSDFMDRVEIRVPNMKGITPGLYAIVQPLRVYKGKVEANLRVDALQLLEAA